MSANRQQMMNALAAAGIPIARNASASRVQSMYDQLIVQNAAEAQHENDANVHQNAANAAAVVQNAANAENAENAAAVVQNAANIDAVVQNADNNANADRNDVNANHAENLRADGARISDDESLMSDEIRLERRHDIENELLNAEYELYRRRRDTARMKREALREERELAAEENAAIVAEHRDIAVAAAPIAQIALPVAPVAAIVAPPANARRTEFHDIKYAVEVFTGEDPTYDVHDFIAQLDNVFELSNADERLRVYTVRQKTDRAAKLTLTNVMTYNAMKETLLDEFGRQLTPADIERLLRQRKWNRKEETAHYYVLYMEKLARRMGRDRLTEVQLVDTIIDGMCETYANAQFLHGSQTIRELKDRLRRYEHRFRTAVSTAATVVAQPSRTGSEVKPKPNATASSGSVTQTSATNVTAATRCYNCSKMGHLKNACPYPIRAAESCFKCWELGHRHQACPNPRKALPPMPTASQQVAAVMPIGTEDEADNWAALSAMNLVSVAFSNSLVQGTEFTDVFSLFDTGSPTSFVRESMLPYEVTDTLRTSKFVGFGGQQLKTYGRINCCLKFGNQTELLPLYIVPDKFMLPQMILGRDFLEKFRIYLTRCKLLYTKERLTRINDAMSTEIAKRTHFCALSPNELSIVNKFDLLRPLQPIAPLSASHCNRPDDVIAEESVHDKGKILTVVSQVTDIKRIENEPNELCGENELTDIEEVVGRPKPILGENLTQQQADELMQIINECYLMPDGIAVEPMQYEMQIRLTSDVPFHSPPRRLSPLEKETVQRTIDGLLRDGIIRPSNSPYASAIVLVDKKNGEKRMCVDYRGINKVTVRDNYPLPLIDDCIERLGGKNFYAVLDLESGFHQVKIEEASKKYTSFVVPNGQYEYERMPFGLKNAPAVFQRYVNGIFRDMTNESRIVIYIDDISFGSEGFDGFKLLVRDVLTRVTERGLKLNLSKCRFGSDRINYLGYTISADGIVPNDAHVAAIMNYPMPRNAREVKSCVGLFSYFRRFVPQFSTIARPLQALQHKDAIFSFDQECVDAFCRLRDHLITAPVLAIYDSKRTTELHTDASAHGYGAALMQKQDDGKFHPVSYYSRTTTAAESRYHSFELETLAIIYALRRFRVYLEGIPFKIVTDCNSLTMTLAKKQVNPRIARWALELENYNYVIQHRNGVSMGHVDALSRCHADGPADENGIYFAGEETIENLLFDEIPTDELPNEGLPKERYVRKSAAERKAGCGLVAMVNSDEIDFQLQVTQNRDPTIAKTRERLLEEEMSEYELTDGLVYRKDKNDRRLLYVPAEMEENVIRMIHERIGHQSVDKCRDKIRENYWFPQMRQKVERFIRNCIRCIMHSAPVRVSERNLYSIPKKPVPFDTIHLDHFGPLPSLISKRKHILVVIDAFTKYVKLYPTNSTSTREVTASLDKYFSYYSRPRRVIIDRGSCFTSDELSQYLSQRNIKQVKVAVASPQANGQVERVNRVIKSMLGKLSEPMNHGDWSNQLLRVEYAINNTTHSTTGQTPSMLMFGVEQRGEIVEQLTEYLNEKCTDETTRDLVKVRGKAAKAIDLSQKYAAGRAAQKNRSPKTYEVGDYIMIRNVDTTIGSSKKFIPQYRGPYVIHKILGHDRYVVRDVENCQLTQRPYDGVVEANRIRMWLEPTVAHETNLKTITHPPGTTDETAEPMHETPNNCANGITDDESDEEETNGDGEEKEIETIGLRRSARRTEPPERLNL